MNQLLRTHSVGKGTIRRETTGEEKAEDLLEIKKSKAPTEPWWGGGGRGGEPAV